MIPEVPILYRDEWMVVVDKPSMLLSVPGRLPENHDSVATRVQAIFPEALTVHRLDWETSGLLVMALGKDMHRRLSKLFQERQVDKDYVAVVDGLMGDHGHISLPLLTDWPNRPRQMVTFEGKASLTHWHVMERHGDRTRVALKPITGRSHQLRVHLSAMGHPILGDRLYAEEQVMKKAERLLLHATHLAFEHPMTGQPMHFHAPCPF